MIPCVACAYTVHLWTGNGGGISVEVTSFSPFQSGSFEGISIAAVNVHAENNDAPSGSKRYTKHRWVQLPPSTVQCGYAEMSQQKLMLLPEGWRMAFPLVFTSTSASGGGGFFVEIYTGYKGGAITDVAVTLQSMRLYGNSALAGAW